MSTPLRNLLAQFRDSSRTKREKGTYFERLAVAFHKNDAAYPPKVFQRVITVSLETIKIVRSLPPLGDLS